MPNAESCRTLNECSAGCSQDQGNGGVNRKLLKLLSIDRMLAAPILKLREVTFKAAQRSPRPEDGRLHHSR